MTTATVCRPPALFRRRGRVELITLHRPERLSAWSADVPRLVREPAGECHAAELGRAFTEKRRPRFHS